MRPARSGPIVCAKAEPKEQRMPATLGTDVRAGDVVEVSGHRVGDKPRLGEILEVLGLPEHIHYRVRWDDERESIYYPSNDAVIRRARPPRRRKR
jgi:hypothetical protein